ncbi:MAG: 50S ribosomal protein L23 [bacterium]|nr:50S ribosomal protein L23 [bacterium]
MALLDFLKKKKQQESPEPQGEELSNGKKGKKKEAREPKKETVKKERKGRAVSYAMLLRPHVTEKASVLAGRNVYVFQVSAKATKLEIASAVQDIYGVPVQQVNIVNIPSKKIRVGKRQGVKSGYKKAMVSVKQGHQIDMTSS